jgi:hypothetical protein
MCPCRELERLFHNFAEAWNSIRGKVKRYGCREFHIPVMDIETSLALCLVEPRDQGIYITAILDYLANLQNSFIEDVVALGMGANPETPDSESTTREFACPPTVHLQSCKVGEGPFFLFLLKIIYIINKFYFIAFSYSKFWIMYRPVLGGYQKQ